MFKVARLFLSVSVLGAALVLLGTSPVYAAYTLVSVVDTTASVPDGGTFTNFSIPSISGATVAFYANYSGGTGSQGIFTATSGKVATVARNGGASSSAPGGGSFSGFGNPAISGATTTFQGFCTGDTPTFGIFTGSAGTLSAAARETSGSAPGGGTFSSFGVPAISGTNTVFIAAYTRGKGRAVGVLSSSGGKVSPVAEGGPGTASAVPGGGTFTNFLSPSISGTTTAFLGFYAGGTGNKGIFTGSGGALTAVARNQPNTVPGGGAFDSFGAPAISGTSVAFQASYSGGAGNQGVFVSSGGTIRLVAANGGATANAPGGGTFTSFDSVAASGTNIAFLGSTGGGGGLETAGIFLATKGGLQSVVRQGDPAFGSTITSLNFGSSGLDGEKVAFSYRLANGKSGVAIASPAPSTPAVP